MVAGVEKMTSQPTPRVTEILASAGDCSGEIRAGSTFPSLFAMIARRHMHDFGTRREHLAAVAVKNHANGALNPDAHLRKVITLEDLGFVPRGQGGFCSAAGYTARDGAKPMNSSGGLKSKGHPVGATGVGQICDVVQQIRGEAGERQLARHSLGLAENLGGSGASCVVTILGEV